MTQIIKAHGLNFAVESDGFVRANATADRDAGVEAIQAALLAMDADRVRTLHADGLAWIAADCSSDRPADYDRLERIGERIATAGWSRPGAASLSLSASK